MSVTTDKKQFYIDGKPLIIISGEFHYYRSKPDLWQEMINLIKEAGCNAIATYVPWVLHEFYESDFDFDGRTNESLNFKKFLKLVKDSGLYLIVRPGPFIMAEMHNDGIPRWVSKKYPETVPITWDGRERPTVTLDYTNKDYLDASRKWYNAFISEIREYVHPKGNIIGFQLDNEVGMLSWVSNSPDLTDVTLNELKEHIINTHGYDNAAKIYGFDINDAELFKQNIRTPKEEYVLNLQEDLGEYMRVRFKNYFDELKGYADAAGIKDIPYFINIHGCSQGAANRFPIGISQLYKSWQGNDYISATDTYVGDVDVPSFVHHYMLNKLTDATNGSHQPLTSLEFSCGDGNYGDSFSKRYRDNRIEAMSKLFIAMGNKVINNYVFTGGYNYRVDKDLDNGTNRVANTGEEHGYAAPVSADGKKRWTYSRTKQVITQMVNLSYKLTSSFEETCSIIYGFIPNYFMTEYFYNKSDINKEFEQNLSFRRANSHWESILKTMLAEGYNFSAVNIQDNEIPTGNLLILPSALYMERNLQEKVAKYINNGGNCFIIGDVPIYDMHGNECKILYNLLGIIDDYVFKPNKPRFKACVETKGFFGEYPGFFRGAGVQLLKLSKDVSEFMSVYLHDGYTCGYVDQINSSKIAVMTANRNSNMEFTSKVMEYFEIKKVAYTNENIIDVITVPTVNGNDEKFIYTFNLNDNAKVIDIHYKNECILEKYELLGGETVMIPMNLKFDNCELLISDNEVYEYCNEYILFRLCTTKFYAKFKTNLSLECDDDDVSIIRDGNYVVVNKKFRKYNEDFIKIKLRGKVND